jgi:membrane associated rhomboid family serine protease
MSTVETQTCYRHADRETRVSCSSCGRPICPDCMTPTPVGMRCPECSKQRTEVKTMASLRADPTLTYVIIAINVVAFLAQMSTGTAMQAGGRVFAEGALFGPLVADGQWYRLISGGFLHGGLLHIAFNMYFLFTLGQMMEPAMGKLRFGALYATSLLGGSLGVMLLSPNSVTVGASGAVFGLLGAAVVVERSQGIGLMQSGLGITMLLNLGITFLVPNISIGGHLGGLAVGALCGYVMLVWAPAQRSPRAKEIALGVVVALGVLAAVASVIAARAAEPSILLG